MPFLISFICFCLVSLGSSLWALSVTNGLAAHWSGDAAGNVALDQSGNGNNGTMTGTQSVPGIFGSAFNFDGTDDFISVSNSSSLNFGLNDSFTLSTWFQTSDSLSEQRIMGKQTFSGQNGVYLLDLIKSGQDTVLRFFMRDTAGAVSQLIGSVHLADGNLHHIAGVRDTSTDRIRFYIDGVEQGSTTDNTQGNYASNINFLLGSFTDSTAGGAKFEGLVDDAAVYNRALSSTEISTIFNEATVSTVPELNSIVFLSLAGLCFFLRRK